MILYHGSKDIIEKPIYGQGKKYNDYGLGFYCTDNIELAKEWGTSFERSGYANRYQIDCTELKILDLNDDKYCILHWLAILLSNREFDTPAGLALEAKEFLKKNFMLDYKEYDIIKGYRADDSYTQVVEAFLLNQINIFEVEHLFYKGSLGNQIFLKSKKAFEHIEWLESYEVVMLEEYKNSDMYARREVNRFLKERMKAILIDGYTVPGITARYAIQNPLVYNHVGNCETSSGYEPE